MNKLQNLIVYGTLALGICVILLGLWSAARNAGRDDIRKEAEDKALGYFVADKYGNRVFVWSGAVLP